MKSYYFAILAAIVWGIAPIAEKMGLKNIEPMAGVLVRSAGVAVGAIVMSLISSSIFKSALKADPTTIIFLFMGAILASILGQIFFYNALKHGEVSKMVPIAATYPLVSFLLGLLFFGESFTVLKGLGVIFVILGVFFLR